MFGTTFSILFCSFIGKIPDIFISVLVFPAFLTLNPPSLIYYLSFPNPNTHQLNFTQYNLMIRENLSHSSHYTYKKTISLFTTTRSFMIITFIPSRLLVTVAYLCNLAIELTRTKSISAKYHTSLIRTTIPY